MAKTKHTAKKRAIEQEESRSETESNSDTIGSSEDELDGEKSPEPRRYTPPQGSTWDGLVISPEEALARNGKVHSIVYHDFWGQDDRDKLEELVAAKTGLIGVSIDFDATDDEQVASPSVNDSSESSGGQIGTTTISSSEQSCGMSSETATLPVASTSGSPVINVIDVSSDEDREFEVDKIIGRKLVKDMVLYKIKWKDHDAATWEPIFNFNANDKLKEFEKSRRRKYAMKQVYRAKWQAEAMRLIERRVGKRK